MLAQVDSKTRVTVICLVLAVLLHPAFAAPAKVPPIPQYRVVMIHPPAGYTILDANLSDNGTVYGQIQYHTLSKSGGRMGRAFVWTAGVMKLLPLAKGYEWADAVGADSQGRIGGTMGQSWDGAWMGTSSRACVWDEGTVTLLPSLPSAPDGQADFIDAQGDIVGKCVDTSDMPSPDNAAISEICQWEGSRATDLGPGAPVGLTESGTVYGANFSITNGVKTVLSAGTSDAVSPSGMTITQVGPNAGDYLMTDSAGSKRIALDFQVKAVSGSGCIVGYKPGPGGSYLTVGCLWVDGREMILNSLLASSRPFARIAEADAINRLGWILCMAALTPDEAKSGLTEFVLLKPTSSAR